MTEAEHAVDVFNARQDCWPGSKFKPPKRATSEHDPELPHVRFYRWPDGSVARLEDGELTS
jgi:hypothetical protein